MISIKSKFNSLPIFIATFLTVLPLLVIYLSSTSPVAGMLLPILLLLFVIFFWMTMFRTRAHKLTIDDRYIIVNRYFGLGKSITYEINGLDGFIVLFEVGKLGISETLFILENGKRIASISTFYQSNFDELKQVLREKIRDLGEKEYNSKEESAEMLK
ncbi:hypothetical protein [Flavobacterium hydatis]|uniref:DUF304 domain-containing protein n=1 Tax=Flavobacterium hydatis TaxID=991 RepID=A0A086A421_FLAHY|nr:hypothetical protein [Flavobacterium hydatis]KFF11435.1 hypothetical protein IW20_19245 [Flavobacterium hydatis]OXA93633.1 hypothetical protein B0A62_12835 [Flavobacterium hydatis]